ncbi:MAG TPA: 4-hydroxy-3-methylbut-2-enyl diphosphate reductase, partial [Sutterella sp.]|nr:4-hydroxy-3-methylbut-2-enyl diphosphate reductase [Sutterella sp.]
DKGRVIIDATCPLVMKVHREVVLMHEKGLLVIMVGHKGHAEVEGTMGQIEGGIVCVSSVEEVRKLSFPAGVKTGFVTQTTLSIDETQEIVTELRLRFPGIESMGEADICYATHSRQAAVRDLAGKADLFLVIGSKTSSNSNRLRDLAAQTCEEAYLIDSCADIDLAWLEGKATVAVTAGASAPEHLVQETVDFLKRHGADSVLTMPGVPDTIHFPLPTMI